MTDDPMTAESFAEWAQERAPWLEVRAVERTPGAFEIVVVIDGTYSRPGAAKSMRAYHAARFARMLAVEWAEPAFASEGSVTS
jgi:hypothetical protein